MLDINKIDFNKLNGLIPAVIQDQKTLQVLMVGFMNQDAVIKTLETKRVTFFSRTKNRLWEKGETSGNFLNVVDILLDCDNDSLLIFVNPIGSTCHTGDISCFGNKSQLPLSAIGLLDKIITDRINTPKLGSYTNQLFDRGIKKIAQKVGEEGVEVVIAALKETDLEYLGEMTDLVYHALVLLHAKNLTLDDLAQVILSRHQEKISK